MGCTASSNLLPPHALLRNNPISSKERSAVLREHDFSLQGESIPDSVNHIRFIGGYSHPEHPETKSELDRVRDETAKDAVKMSEKLLEFMGLSGEAAVHYLKELFADTRTISDRAQLECLNAAQLRGAIRDGQRPAEGVRSASLPKRIFVGPTARVEDHPISDEGLKKLLQGIRSLNPRRFKKCVEEGPADGSILFEKPNDIFEAGANLVRWTVATSQKKLRVRFPQVLRDSVRTLLEQRKFKWKTPLVGGVAAVCSLTTHALGHTVTMYNEGEIPVGIGNYFPRNVQVVNDVPEITTMGDLVDRRGCNPPGHFSFSLNKFRFPRSMNNWVVSYQDQRRLKTATIDSSQEIKGRDHVITGTTYPVGFSDAISDERLLEIGRTSNVALLTGFQYPTTTEEYRRYFRGIDLIGQGQAAIVVEYAEPRCASTPLELYGLLQLKKSPVTLLALNTNEASGLLFRLNKIREENQSEEVRSLFRQLGLTDDFWGDFSEVLKGYAACSEDSKRLVNGEPWKDPQEDSRWIYDSARLIQRITGLPWVRVRGQYADCTIADQRVPLEQTDFGHIRSQLAFSRTLAALKSALKEGNITSYNQLLPLECVPTAAGLSSNIRLGRYLEERDGRDLFVLGRLARDWFTNLSDGRRLFMAIPHEFRIREHTISAGDTMATWVTNIADILQATHAAVYRREGVNGRQDFVPEGQYDYL